LKLNKAKFVLKLAFRDILDDKEISGIVVLMLSFSFLNLVFFPAFINGLSDTFTEGLIEGQTGHVAIEAQEGRLENADAAVQKVSRLEEPVEVEKVLETGVTASFEGESTTTVLRGTSAQDFHGYTSKMVSGEFLNPDNSEIVVGRFLTEDTSLSSVEGIGVERGRMVALRGENFTTEAKVRGISGTQGGIGGFSERVFMNYRYMEELTGARNEADKIKIILERREEADKFKKKLQSLNTRGEIRTWDEQSNLAEAIDSTFAIVINILSVVGLIVALAAIGVVIFINTSKRVREMGIVRAIGAKKIRVIQIFVLEAFVFGAAGVVLGNIITLGIDSYLAANPIISPVGPISTKVSSELLVSRSMGMLAASLVAGFIPAYLTSKTEIVETIENR
jgi:putative ABC transport system permease protein